MILSVPHGLIPDTKWDQDLVTVCSCRPFVLASTHPLRKVACLICGTAILGYRATIIGVAALTLPDDDQGGVSGDMFIAHSGHFPVPTEQLHLAISTRLRAGRSPSTIS